MNMITIAARAWQPIETAPRDGTTILLFAPAWENAVTGWTFGDDEWQDCPFNPNRLDYRPTHWQPLPSPPTTEDAGER